MPSISKIRFTNVVYEDGMKRYNDEIFRFDGYNGAILLENGGGKTVFIQTALQAIIPHTSLSDRKVKQTLQLDNYPAHIAIEWILSDHPRKYLVTAVSLFLTKDGLDSYRYVYEYLPSDKHGIEGLPFVRSESKRPSDRGEIAEYYQQMSHQYMNAEIFPTIKSFQSHIEDQYHIIANEWDSIVKINSTEGGVEAFFDECKQTNQLFDRLLIPTVEGAIAGHNPNTFADTFEQHRAGFKLYKELKEQIEENKAIEEELVRYSTTYERLFEQQQSYELTKQRAKAVLDEITHQEHGAKIKLDDVQNQLQQWEIEKKNLQMKSQSLVILKEQVLLEEYESALKEQGQSLHEEKDNLSQAEKQYYSLKLAELKRDHKEEQGKYKYLTEQLEELDQNEDIQDLKDRLEENSRGLKGYFSQELEESSKRKHGLTIERQTIEVQLKQDKDHLDYQNDMYLKTKQELDNSTGKVQALQEQKKRICQTILSNPDQESVTEMIPQWEKRFSYLDEQMVKLKNHNKQLEKEITKQQELIKQLEDTKSEKKLIHQRVEFEVRQSEEAHEKQKQALAQLKTQWATVDSLYLRQDSIAQQLKDQLSTFNKEKEVLLYKERIAHRFIDDYGKQDVFFADSYIEKQLNKWKNQFIYLQTGIEFLQSIGESITSAVSGYPLWSITLITTASEYNQVKEKLLGAQREIQFPIEVITTEQASAIVNGESIQISPIVPYHWLSNQIGKDFDEWKEVVSTQANESTNKRREIENTINHWERVTEHFSRFLQDHPYECIQEKREQLSRLSQEIQQITLQQNEIQKRMTEWDYQIATQRELIEKYSSEYNGIEGKLKGAYEYLQLEKETNALKVRQDELTLQIQKYFLIMKKYTIQVQKLEEEEKELSHQIREEDGFYNRILEDPLYLEVKYVTPSYTNQVKSVLFEERQKLKFSMGEISESRKEIQLKIDFSFKELKRLDAAIEELRLDHPSFYEELLFPHNGKKQMTAIRDKMKGLASLVTEIEKKYNQQKTKKDKQENSVEISIKEFNRDFPGEEPVQFTIALSEIEDQLKIEQKQLKDQNVFLIREKNALEKEMTSLIEAFHKLDRFDEAHHFKGPSVQASLLTEEDLQAFTYERIPFVEKVTQQLTQGKDQVTKEWEKVDRAKEMFKGFCKKKITNFKMREMATQGIESKKTYKEVLEFQSHMQKRIQTAIKYNEMTIMNHDKELEQFVTHINNHLTTIADELTLIPKKTKVKVEDKWKEIYQFSIPRWTEEEGKSRIRKHVDWILDQLDSDRFKTVDGGEDSGKVRKEIETWVQSKQLLRVVMNDEIMKVSCRKVTNDNQVTTRSYSWEQSNVWSGGEKWSKNMTLFLGILNYVAEKQKHIETNMKRHRVVIMDNPFGKASSDHVLNPVFFIAEQLGFQIIALTAHAEGKFLRDYFPVIYSCRLRKAADSNKQIMTKVKQLHQAFFQDHEPQSLERLGEVEQLELFK